MTKPNATLYADVGALVHGDGSVHSVALAAMRYAHQKDVNIGVVLMSGAASVVAAAQAEMLGTPYFIGEGGALLTSIMRKEVWLTGRYSPSDEQTVRDQIHATGAHKLLLSRAPGRLDLDGQSGRGREASISFCGDVSVDWANTVLEGLELGLEFVEIGATRQPASHHNGSLRRYQLRPAGVSLWNAVQEDMGRRGIAPETAFAVGASPEAIAVGRVVGSVWVTPDAYKADERLRAAVGAQPNAFKTSLPGDDGLMEVLSEFAPAA
jgi:hypothetical protein